MNSLPWSVKWQSQGPTTPPALPSALLFASSGFTSLQ